MIRNRNIRFARYCPEIVLVALLLFTATSYAEKLRITTWSLEGATSTNTNGIFTNSLESVAAALKQLDPDVILLQQVADWKMCVQLAQFLKPSIYEVLICSAFQETPLTGKRNRQAAILSKRKAYFSWSEAWESPAYDKLLSCGFVFAAIQTADHRIGLFSVELDPGAASKILQQDQWGKQIQSIRKWVTNRPESAVVAGKLLFNETPRSANGRQQDNVINNLLSSPLAITHPIAGSKTPLLMPKNNEALPAVILSQFPQTYEVDLELADAPVVPSPSLGPVDTVTSVDRIKDEPFSKPIESVTEEASQAPSMDSGIPSHDKHAELLWLALTPVAIVSLGIVVWLLARREDRPRPEMHSIIPATLEMAAGSGDSVLVTSPSITGSIIEKSDAPSVSQPVIQQLQVWQQRALAAEQKAEKANYAIRDGIMNYLGEWVKQKLFRKLIEDRAQLLESQRVATIRALAVDERLSRLEVQIQQQNQAYEQRIERLTQELAVTKEESRALIRTQIIQIKSEMEAARARLIAESELRRQTVIS